MQTAEVIQHPSARKPESICCSGCGRLIFDGTVIKGVSVISLEGMAKGKCKLCKTWVRLPVKIAA